MTPEKQQAVARLLAETMHLRVGRFDGIEAPSIELQPMGATTIIRVPIIGEISNPLAEQIRHLMN